MALQVGNKGSSTIEATIILIAWVSLTVTALTCLSKVYADAWCHFLMYESLICAVEGNTFSYCEEKAIAEFKQYLPYMEHINVRISNSNEVYEVQFEYPQATWRKNLKLKAPTRTVRW